MPRFHPLTVTQVDHTTRDAVVVTLDPGPAAADFIFTQGQYLTFRRDFDGTEIRRSYSICAPRGSARLRVGIKRVDGGAFSTWANTELKTGAVVEAMPPNGRFHTPVQPDADHHYLAFAGGSGITPILSIIATVLAEEPKSRITLVYANRGLHSIMFREELEDLKNLHMGRLTVIHVLESDAQEIELFQGRVDAAKCAALFERLIDIQSVDMAFICGPEPMMLAISGALRDHGLSDDQIKFELFKSGQPGRLATPAPSLIGAEAHGAEAQIMLDGTSRAVTIAPGQSVLQAALDAGLDAPYACTAGVCSTCRCKVLEGEVEMATNHALEDYEVAQGFALSCQSRPLSDKLVVTYDV